MILTVELLVNKPLLNVVGAEFRMKQTKYVLCTFEEFILVDIWIHCCTVHETGLNEHWKNAGLYTLATKD